MSGRVALSEECWSMTTRASSRRSWARLADFGILAALLLSAGFGVPAAEKPDESPYRGKILLFGAVSATNKEIKAANVQAIRPDGSGLETVCAFEGAQVSRGRVSPDGRSLAVEVVAKDGGRSVWVVGPSGDRRKLADMDRVVAWSPDGKSLACYRGAEEGFDSVALDVATGRERRLPLPKHDVVEGWTPDGSRLVVVAGNRDLMVDTPRGLYPQRQLYVCKSDGSERRLLTPEEKFDQLSARYSPDGKHVAHWRRENPDKDRVLHSGVVRHADGTGAREFVQFDKLIASLDKGHRGKPDAPCWSPDGKQILWVVWHSRRVASGSDSIEYYDLVFTSPERGYERRVPLYEKGIVSVANVDWR